MRNTRIGNTGISCTVLGFGCSALLGRSGKRASLRALGAAWDAGITLYDTAHSYGYGESEALLGQFLSGRRDQAVISTKFGIVSVRPPLWKRLAKPAARALISLAPSTRAAIRKQAGRQFLEGQFSVDVLHKSLDLSLRKLRTEYVDLFFLHAPPASVLEQDDLLAAMEKLVDSGKVRAAGISAGPEVIRATLDQKPSPLRVLQFPCNLFDFSAPEMIETHPNAAGMGTIANHPFGGITRVRQCREILTRIALAPEIDPVLREKLGSVNDEVLADVVLNMVLSHRSINAVVPAMMRLDHLAKNLSAVTRSRFSPEEFSLLRNRISHVQT